MQRCGSLKAHLLNLAHAFDDRAVGSRKRRDKAQPIGNLRLLSVTLIDERFRDARLGSFHYDVTHLAELFHVRHVVRRRRCLSLPSDRMKVLNDRFHI
jgi:hypothetical protein